MGWLKNIKNAVVKVGHQTGDALNNKYVKGALATGLAATGVGVPAAAALMAGTGALSGTLRSGGGLKGAVTGAGQGAVTGAASGLAGGGLRGIASKFGASAAGKMLPGGAPQQTSAQDPMQGDGEYPDDHGMVHPGGGGGMLSNIGGFLSGHKNDILDYGQAAEGVYDKYRSVQDYNARKPLRDAGMAALLDQSRPDTSSVFADPNAPQRYRSVNVGSRGRI